MFHLRILILFLLLTLVGHAATDEASVKIHRLNCKSFSLIGSEPSEAERINAEVFRLLHSGIEPIIRSNAYSIRGILLFQRGEYDRALKNYFICLDIRQKKGDLNRIADIYLNIANLYYHINNYKSAVTYYKKCLYYSSRANVAPLEMIPLYNGLTLAYEELGKEDSLAKYYGMAFRIIDRLKDQTHSYVSDLYSNYGQYKETNNDYEQAMLYYNKALNIQQKTHDQRGMGWTFHHMGIVKDYQQNSAEAKQYFHKAEKLAKEQDDLATQRDIYESWIVLYTREKKADSIAYYFDRYKLLNDSINEEKTNQQLLEAEAKYNTEKTQIRLKAAEVEKETFKWSLIAGLLLAALILFFLIRNYRQKQRIANMQVDLKNREIDELLGQQETASYAAMLEGQDHERFRIAQDLHDRLGSTLAAIKLGMQGDPVSTNEQNQQLVDTAITEVRAIAHNLSGGNIERYGLNVALAELKTTLERSGKMQVHLYLEQVSFGNQLSIELYRIVQELVSNTLKHAGASEITIQTNSHSDSLNLIYEDNGSGFDPAIVGHGMGLRNIRLRLSKWDGTLEIDAQPKRGTIAIIHVPKTTAA